MTIDNKQVDRMYKQKKFFYIMYDGQIDKQGNFKDNQYMRVFQAKQDYSKVIFFDNIDEAVKFVSSKSRYAINTYYNLSLTNAMGGTEIDLTTRSVIAFDFDKKDFEEDFSHKDLIDKFKKLGLWYHALVDSGNGYHAYMCIESTRDYDKMKKVTQSIGKRLGADVNAMKSTQVLRVPFSFNVKDESMHKQVNIINMFDRSTIKRYDINNLYTRFCCNVKDQKQQDTNNRVTNYTISNTNIPYCIEQTLLEGSSEGTRYEDLQRIVVTLRDRNKSLNEIKALCKEWASKSSYKDNVDYRAEHIYNNVTYIKMECKGCKHTKDCFNRVESDFNYTDEFDILTMSETQTSKLKASSRRGVRIMKSNDLLIYSILKNHTDGLYKDEIIKDMTYKKKCRFSKDTLTKALKSLEDNGFIESSGKPKFYQLVTTRDKVELTYNISFGATYEAVKGNISTDELRLYNYMRYIHHKQQRDNSNSLKGNLLQVNQVDLAKDLDVTQGRISQMIDKLLDELLLGIWYRQPSQNNGFDYNIYRLNY